MLIICRFIAKCFDILFHLILPAALGVDVGSHHVTDAETEAYFDESKRHTWDLYSVCHSWGSTPRVGKPWPFVQIWLASSLVNKMLLEHSHALSRMPLLLLCYKSRIEQLQQRPCGKNLKCLLSDSLQQEFAYICLNSSIVSNVCLTLSSILLGTGGPLHPSPVRW